jgi:sporulation protein YlmC with PRC-barrel domain
MISGRRGDRIELTERVNDLVDPLLTKLCDRMAPSTLSVYQRGHRRCEHCLRLHDGFWMGGTDDGLGYPMIGYGFGGTLDQPSEESSARPETPANAAAIPDNSVAAKSAKIEMKGAAPQSNSVSNISGAGRSSGTAGYWPGRSGYEVRTLMASANILAQRGFQQPCEDVLGATHDIYKRYLVEMRDAGAPRGDEQNWRRQQIAAAKPVIGLTSPLRSDQLVGAEVRNSQDQSLGTVDDLVMSPQTGKIAYLVIGRGGFFGIDEKYVPVPWADFKTPPQMNLLVLDSTDAVMKTAPEVAHDRFSKPGDFEQVSEKVDGYWKAHL